MDRRTSLLKQRMKWRKKIGKEPENQLEARQGGVGCILLSHLWNYCLKIVPLVKEGKLNGGFWQEARSVFVYRTTVRPMASLLSCPLPVTYWIHKDDASLVKYLATHDKLSQEAVYLDDYLVTMSIDDKPCLQYKDYRLIPDDLLCRIYNKRNSRAQKADLLLVYPIRMGDKSMADLLNGQGPSDIQEIDILMMAGQILKVILEMHKDGCFHGDIKPSNIMFSRLPHSFRSNIKRWSHLPDSACFILTDYGSLGADNQRSTSGTHGFFSQGNYNLLREKGYSHADSRSLLDGFALAMTIFALAAGTSPLTPLVNPDVVHKAWPGEVSRIFDELYNVAELTFEKMEELCNSLVPDQSVSETNQCFLLRFKKLFPFEENSVGTTDIAFGRFHEQLPFSELFLPLMRLRKPSCAKAPDEPSAFIPPCLELLPMVYSGGIWRECYFFAPDDANTGKRPVSFEGYVPTTLANTVPTEGERAYFMKRVEETIFIRSKLENAEKHTYLLPNAEDVVRIDGQWRIMRFRIFSQPKEKLSAFFQDYHFPVHESHPFNPDYFRQHFAKLLDTAAPIR